MGVSSAFLAYLDPGTGMTLVQIIIAAILAVGVMFRHGIASFFSIFVRKRPENENSNSSDSTNDE